MIYDAITSTGAVYRIDLGHGFWAKYRHTATGQYTEVTTERIVRLMVGTALSFPWNDPDSWENADMPVIGKHLHIASMNIWFSSTPITNIIEVDSWDSPLSKTEEGNDND